MTAVAERKNGGDILRELMQPFQPPVVSEGIAAALEQIKVANQQRAIEIALAVVSLDGQKPESFSRDWPGVDIGVVLSDPATVARVDTWAENTVVENYARALQSRRMATKALSILETTIDENGTGTQARELLDLLAKGRQVRDPEKPVRSLHFVFGQANIETPFGGGCVDVLGRDPGQALVDVCAAIHVRDDSEIDAITSCLQNPMSRVSLRGW
jgi:hypothetical protein